MILRCRYCRLPYARFDGETLVIETRHHGQVHFNTITIKDLIRLSKRARAERREIVFLQEIRT